MSSVSDERGQELQYAGHEAEEETTRVNDLKRKLQRDLDEANEQIEALQRELQNQRNKAR